MKNESPAPVDIPGDTESKAWTPAVGERVSGRQAGGGDRIVTGKLRYLYTHQSEVVDDCDGVVRVVVNSTLRPADPGGWPRKQAEVEMYGTQPGVLPETLPAGTKMRDGWVATSLLAFTAGLYFGKMRMNGGMDIHSGMAASSIDWTSVPRPPKPASPQPIDAFRQTVKCDDCGSDLDALQACKRTRVVQLGYGEVRKEYVPGTFCASCPPKPASGSTGHQAPNREGCGPSPAEPVVPERPKLSPDGFLDRAYLDEQTAKRIPGRDAARLNGAQSRHHQALAALDVKSGRPRYAETSRVFSTATWEEDS